MFPKISIIIPHKPTPDNDKSLFINMQRLLEGCSELHRSSLEIILDTSTPRDPYKIWNECAVGARGDILVFSNSDVIMAPGWDIGFVEHCVSNTIVSGYLIEPGNIGVASVNLHRDFGKTPDEFDYDRFVEFCAEHSFTVDEVKEERAWYMPSAMNREWFLSTGGFDTALGFPTPNDIEFFDRAVVRYGTKFLRVRSYAYHFQALSTR